MADILDLNKLSASIGSIVDRKVRSVSQTITGSTSYLRALTAQAQGYSTQALGHSTTAAGHAVDASTAASSALIVWNSFTSTYIGVRPSDPTTSALGNSINAGAFYIRESDGRLRYTTGFNGSGVPIWADATVTADLSSLGSAGANVFLALQVTTSQTVKGPVTFQNTVLVPRVVSWSSTQAAAAIDVNDRIVAVQNSINAETTRATAAETAINNTRVAKTGDIMSGPLSVVSTADNASMTVRNSSTNGRAYRLNATNDGRFRIVDDTGTVERFAISSTGNVSAAGGFSAGGFVTGGGLIASRLDGNDPSLTLQQNNVSRWIVGRSVATARFYVARMNNTGVYIDDPISISEASGQVTLNKTEIRDTLNTKGNITVDSVAAGLVLNNTSGINSTSVVFRNVGVTRWTIGRNPADGVFSIMRYSDSGVLIDSPIRINEINGWTTVSNLQSTGVLNAATSVSAPQVLTTATNTGRNIAIGDDVWLGDSNIADGMSIRGQNDFNAGFVRFGNANALLGCTANDSDLKYGGNKVAHAGNIGSFFQSGSNANGYWERNPAGRFEMWGKKLGSLTQGLYSVDLPNNFTDVNSMNIQLTILNASGGTSSAYDVIAQVKDWTTSSFVMVIQDTDNASYISGFKWRITGY